MSKKILIAAVLFMVPAISLADVLNLSWSHPTQYTDGSALDLLDIDATEITCSSFTPTGGTSQACPVTTTERVPAPDSSGYFDVGVVAQGGTYCFKARTVMITGQVSAYSTAACKAVQPKVPNPPVFKTIETVAYLLKYNRKGQPVMKVAGTVPLWITCGQLALVQSEKTYHTIPADQVDLKRRRYARHQLVAACAPDNSLG